MEVEEDEDDNDEDDAHHFIKERSPRNPLVSNESAKVTITTHKHPYLEVVPGFPKVGHALGVLELRAVGEDSARAVDLACAYMEGKDRQVGVR